MSQPQYAIMRFAKYKGPEISNIEAHNERTKEKYASNPDIDCSVPDLFLRWKQTVCGRNPCSLARGSPNFF